MPSPAAVMVEPTGTLPGQHLPLERRTGVNATPDIKGINTRLGSRDMRAKCVVVGIVVLVVGLAYVAGYWPEHRRRAALEVDAESL
jgi:hypothetical protein